MGKEPQLVGHLDGYFQGQLAGWATDATGRAALSVDVYLDGTKIAEVPCRHFRPDVKQAGYGDGCHGFQYALPSRIKLDNRDHVVTVRFGDSQKELLNGTLPLPCTPESILFSAINRQVWLDGYWEIAELQAAQGLEIRGYVIRPANWFGEVTFTINGRPFPTVELAPGYPQVAAKFGLEEERVFAFRCHAPARMLDGMDGYEFAFTDPGLRPFDRHQTFHYFPIGQPMPAAALRSRVAGSADAAFFELVGATVYGQLNNALQWTLRKSLAEFETVLDWGCGCARVLRYLAARHPFKLVGVDVDAEAISWCKQAFPRQSFHRIDLSPPMPIPAEEFDLVYGISVFTHLREHDQMEWLAELHRVSRPGAVLLFSIHNDRAWFREGLPAAGYLEKQKHGFLDLQADCALDDIISEKGYYRSTFHGTRYIERQWGRFFKVLAVLPGMFSGFQDLVVLVRE